MKILDILFWVFFVLGIIFFIWYIFGKTPTIEQTLLVLIISFLFKIQASVASNTMAIKNLRKMFNALATDFKEHIKHK